LDLGGVHDAGAFGFGHCGGSSSSLFGWVKWLYRCKVGRYARRSEREIFWTHDSCAFS
jgi:hypothetical protein